MNLVHYNEPFIVDVHLTKSEAEAAQPKLQSAGFVFENHGHTDYAPALVAFSIRVKFSNGSAALLTNILNNLFQ